VIEVMSEAIYSFASNVNYWISVSQPTSNEKFSKKVKNLWRKEILKLFAKNMQ
jgi:hypothetical protein